MIERGGRPCASPPPGHPPGWRLATVSAIPNGNGNGNGHPWRAATVPLPADRLPPQNLEAEQGVLGGDPAGQRRPARGRPDPEGRGLLSRQPPGHLPGHPRPVRPGKPVDLDHPGRGASPPRGPGRRSAATRRSRRSSRACRTRPTPSTTPQIVREKAVARDLIEQRQRDPPRGVRQHPQRPTSCSEAAERRIFADRRGAGLRRDGRAEGRRHPGDGPDLRQGRGEAPDLRRADRLLRAGRHDQRLPGLAVGHPGGPAEHGQDGLRAEHLRARRGRQQDRASCS